MYPEELKRSISKGKTDPLYFFYGKNTHLIEEKTGKIISFLFSSHDPDLDLQYYDAQEHEPSEIVQSARTIPFIAKKKLVIVKGAHFFKNDQWKKFQGYFSKPSGYCCLIFILLIEGRDKKEKAQLDFLKQYKQYGVLVSFANPRWESQIIDLIKSGLAGYGKKITPNALTYLAENIGKDAQTITNELEKIVLYCGEKKSINIKDVEDVLSHGHDATVFKLVDEIGSGNIDKSLIFLNKLLNEGQHPLAILKMIARQFRLISMAKDGLRKGDSALHIGKRLGIYYENIIKKIIQQARGWPAERLGSAFEEIFQSDCKIKSSRINSKIILENLIYRLTRLRGQPLA